MLVSECRDKLVLFVAAVVVFLFDVQLGVFAVSSKCVRFFFLGRLINVRGILRGLRIFFFFFFTLYDDDLSVCQQMETLH